MEISLSTITIYRGENKRWLLHFVNGEKESDREKGPTNNAKAHGKAHGKPHAFAYMDQWRLAMEDWDQEGANQETACGDGDRNLDKSCKWTIEGPMGSWVLMVTHEKPKALVSKLVFKREAIIWDSSLFFNTVEPTYKKTRQTWHPILGLLVHPFLS